MYNGANLNLFDPKFSGFTCVGSTGIAIYIDMLTHHLEQTEVIICQSGGNLCSTSELSVEHHL